MSDCVLLGRDWHVAGFGWIKTVEIILVGKIRVLQRRRGTIDSARWLVDRWFSRPTV